LCIHNSRKIQAPAEASYTLAKRRAGAFSLFSDCSSAIRELSAEPEDDARVALSAAAQAQALATAKLDEAMNATSLVDTTTFADASLAPESSKPTVAKVKKKGKPRLTPKEKKERGVRVFFFLFVLLSFAKVFV
jgi:hypothetical protein